MDRAPESGADLDPKTLAARMDNARHRASAAARACAQRIADVAERDRMVALSAMAPREAAELRSCIEEYVRALRDSNESPERAVILVKSLIAEAVPRSADVSKALVDAAVAWSIQAYFSNKAP